MCDLEVFQDPVTYGYRVVASTSQMWHKNNCVAKSVTFQWCWVQYFPKAQLFATILTQNYMLIIGNHSGITVTKDNWSWIGITVNKLLKPTKLVFSVQSLCRMKGLRTMSCSTLLAYTIILELFCHPIQNKEFIHIKLLLSTTTRWLYFHSLYLNVILLLSLLSSDGILIFRNIRTSKGFYWQNAHTPLHFCYMEVLTYQIVTSAATTLYHMCMVQLFISYMYGSYIISQR